MLIMEKYAILEKENITLAKGKREVLRGLKDSALSVVFLATDADDKFKEQIILKCNDKNIECIEYFSKFDLADITRIDVPCAVLGICKN